MKALIFVYAPTSFQIGGPAPLKQLQYGSMTYADSPTITRSASGAVNLVGGVYLIYSDSDDVLPDVAATSGTQGTDYDILTLTDKDTWPDPPPRKGLVTMSEEEFRSLADQVRSRMQQLLEVQLRAFTQSLSR